MDDPLRVHSPKELELFLEVTPCPRCGHGLTVARLPEARPEGDDRDCVLRAHCVSCNAQRTFHIRWVQPSDDQPSEVVDLAQWVGLYYVYADAIDKGASPAETRQAARLAAQCLTEAMKFYGEDEMPPESAFRKPRSAAAFDSNPANFARTRLRELLAMLPIAARTDPDRDCQAGPNGPEQENASPRAWWKIW